MRRLSEEAITLPAWTLSDVEEYLLERVRGQLLEETAERASSSREPDELEERPCWWILSALARCDGKEAREAYYVGL